MPTVPYEFHSPLSHSRVPDRYARPLGISHTAGITHLRILYAQFTNSARSTCLTAAAGTGISRNFSRRVSFFPYGRSFIHSRYLAGSGFPPLTKSLRYRPAIRSGPFSVPMRRVAR